ncbi:MAG TPA: hypothetical protein EYO07_03490 [Candidatus Marinimicrobia bacterium]|nr:hypothetical protein [Candidatus Neomarinimicrobiota bacterium]
MKKCIAFIIAGLSLSPAQIEFDVSFTPYVTYYLSVVDINTGESNVPIFIAELNRASGAPDTVGVDIEFEIIIDSDALGINNQTLVKVATTQPVSLSAPIHLTNMDLNLASDQIFDDAGNPVALHLDIVEKIEMDQAEQMFSAIVQTGRLPDGIYTFRVMATAEDGQRIIKEDVLSISNPATLQLISPGGVLADTTLNEVYTSFPVFQWESDPCNYVDPITGESGCELFIRVAEFNPQEHSSIDQAIESVTRLPLEQGLGYEPVGFGVSTYQYPATGAGDLEPGKVYVWQIKKVLITTIGNEEILSEILAFKIKDFTETETTSGEGADTSPAGMALRSLIGEDQADEIFGPGGAAEGALATGNITLNGESVDVSFIQSLIATGIAETDADGNETFRPIELLSVEVEE